MSVAGGPPRPAPTSSRDRPGGGPDRWQLREVRGAIGLVATGVATRIALCGLTDPEAAAADVNADARSAGVAVRLESREGGTIDLIIGPLRS